MIAKDVADLIVAVRYKVVFVSLRAEGSTLLRGHLMNPPVPYIPSSINIEAWSPCIATPPLNKSLIYGGVNSGSLQYPGVLPLCGCTHLGASRTNVARCPADQLYRLGASNYVLSSLVNDCQSASASSPFVRYGLEIKLLILVLAYMYSCEPLRAALIRLTAVFSMHVCPIQMILFPADSDLGS
jgi:hypothetical protein